MKRIRLLNTFVDSISLTDVVQEVFACIERGDRARVVFLNALKVYQIDKDPQLKKAMEESEFILADGMPIVWVSRLFGRPLPGRVNGTDLFELLMAEAAQRGRSVYFLGATKENLTRLVTVVHTRHPALIIAGYRDGYFSDDDDLDVIQQINSSGADILFLGFGSPKKEIWSHRHRTALQVPITQGVGGSFDVVAGVVPRAPVWMQTSGLEWFYRLSREPRRMMQRYLITNSFFVLITIKYWIKEKLLT